MPASSSNPGICPIFFDYHQRVLFPAVGLVFAEGPAILCQAAQLPVEAIADDILTYRASQLSTLEDSLTAKAAAAVFAQLQSVETVACDSLFGARHLERICLDLLPSILRMRRHKAPDEIALLRAAISATEAGYAAIEPLLAPGISEIELFARFHMAAVVSAGEPIGELGNDFRGGAMGGGPRPVPLVAGDLIPVDAGAVLRGYTADLCRTYAVSGAWSDAQHHAFDAVADAQAYAESLIAPGVSCREVFTKVHARLDGRHGWSFPHHLGHGIGLSPHEAPRINPHWDDVFEVGDVFTLEPGLYADELRAGVRIEHDYLLTETGLLRLSQPWPTASGHAAQPDPLNSSLQAM